MNIIVKVIVFIIFTAYGPSQSIVAEGTPSNDDSTCSCVDNKDEIQQLKRSLADLSKQVMMQQFFVEEKVRTEGGSGVKVVRATNIGLRNYESATHLSPAAFTIHDHANYDRTVGMGELSIVLNGIEFRTRHNDYKLVMASKKSKEPLAVEDIPFPDVPPQVLSKPTVEAQITEMREWFRAFMKQDKSIRDYTKYFKPAFCYLEGSWTNDDKLVEPFPSDRHLIDATSWDNLHTRIRFTSYSGVKNRLENLAFLPTTIISVNNVTGEAQYAQWNYRIQCSPITDDLPLAYFQQEDDLSYRVETNQTLEQTVLSRTARFKLFDINRTKPSQVLDDIFCTIPGMDNHGSNLSFSVFGEPMYDANVPNQNVPLNSAYYHRFYKSFKSGAGGITHAYFGFNDENLWVAQTSQPRVAPLETEQCQVITNQVGRLATRCGNAKLQFSYAIPLEVIYMTPLQKWNPYNIKFNDDAETAISGGRNGGKGNMALNGIDKTHFYKTPVEFYAGSLDKSDPADTVRTFMYVKSPDGQDRKVMASGTSIVLPEIDGVGRIRLRYPIAPVHGEGSSVWKELNALKDKIFERSNDPQTIIFQMSVALMDPPGEHTHDVVISKQDFSDLKKGVPVKVTTHLAQEHVHELTIIYDPKIKSFRYLYCDSERLCTDGHAPQLLLLSKITL